MSIDQQTLPTWAPRSLSIVAPVYNEERNVEPLVNGISEAVRVLGLPFEILIVDDGSSDSTISVLRGLLPATPELVAIRLRRNFGQTLALQAGLDQARGDAIVTMDGDLQNDPRDIPRLLSELSRGADVVSGWRKNRRDTLLLRKVPSRIANWLIRRVSGIPVHDQGCALKAYRADVVRELNLYADMHRFIAILTMPLGASIREIEVRHHPRIAGHSKYGISRVFSVLVDLFTIQMLTSFRENPLRWFALLGLPFLLTAALTALLAVVSNGRIVVLTAIAFLTANTFLTCLFLGLLGEFVVDASTRGSDSRLLFREWRKKL
jgi:glycosyltransferase involved in cell wall biosynthesis